MEAEMIKYLQTFDERVINFIWSNMHGDIVDGIWVAITHWGDTYLLWLFLGLTLLLFKNTRKAGLTMMLAIPIGVLVVSLIKTGVARLRPFDCMEGIVPLIAAPTDYSFPSGHTCNAFIVAFALARNTSKELYIPAIIVACLIAFSRMYVGVHFPSDLLAGFLIAFIVTSVCSALVNALLRDKSEDVPWKRKERQFS